MAQLKLRAAELGDAGRLAEIRREIVLDPDLTFTTHLPLAGEIEAEIALAKETSTPYLVLEDNGVVVGYATWKQFRPGPGYAHTVEHSLHLAPVARGQGGGRILIEALVDYARSCGVRTLIAGISGVNPGGIAFHGKMGFVEVARLRSVGYKAGRWLDLILMQRDLAPDNPANRD